MRANVALFAAGLSTFAVLYCVQPLLPTFSAEFGVSPAVASLSLAVTTAALALSLIPASSLSEVWGRKPVMIVSLTASSVLAVLLPLCPNFAALVAVRALEGVTLAGVPAVAMAYVGEEMHPRWFGLAMGLYVGGNGLGGMAGRTLVGVLADVTSSWRAALWAIGALCVLCGLVFWALLPGSRRFSPRPLKAGYLAASLWGHLSDGCLPWLYGVGALIMGGFVASYNYIGYHLIEPPYLLGEAEVGWIFSLYLLGTFSSAWMGRLADRRGRSRVLPWALLTMLVGILLTLAGSLPVIVAGIGVLTFGFFGAHSIASGWVSTRARVAKAQAAALYLLCYYLGASLGGFAGGLAYDRGGWSVLVMMVCALVVLALVATARAVSVPSPPDP